MKEDNQLVSVMKGGYRSFFKEDIINSMTINVIILMRKKNTKVVRNVKDIIMSMYSKTEVCLFVQRQNNNNFESRFTILC